MASSISLEHQLNVSTFTGLKPNQIRTGMVTLLGMRKPKYIDFDLFVSPDSKTVIVGPKAIVINTKNRSYDSDDFLWESREFLKAFQKASKLLVCVDFLTHVGILVLDESGCHFIDNLLCNLKDEVLKAIKMAIPWDIIGGEREIIPYMYKYSTNIPNTCAVRSLNAMEKILYYGTFERALPFLFVHQVQKINGVLVEAFEENVTEEETYHNQILQCFSMVMPYFFNIK